MPGVFPAIARLRAKYDRVVFFLNISDKEPGLPLLSWQARRLLRMGALLTNENDLVVVTDSDSQVKWCQLHHVDLFISDEPRTLFEILKTPETHCTLFGEDDSALRWMQRMWSHDGVDFPHRRISERVDWLCRSN